MPMAKHLHFLNQRPLLTMEEASNFENKESFENLSNGTVQRVCSDCIEKRPCRRCLQKKSKAAFSGAEWDQTLKPNGYTSPAPGSNYKD